MSMSTDRITAISRPVITTLTTVEAVTGIVCFGSYALGVEDAESDLDLYVLCDPQVISDTIRYRLLKQIPGNTGPPIQNVTSTWDNPWALQSDHVMPYPVALKANLVRESLAIMADGLAELDDYTRRNIGPCAFLFHLRRVCDAMVSALYTLNEHHDPGTK